MATIGKDDTSGLSSYAGMQDTIVGAQYTATASGTVDTMHIHLYNWNSGEKVKGAIYDSSRNFLGETEEKSTGLSNSAWNSFNMDDTVNIASGNDYILVFWSGESCSALCGITGVSSCWYESGNTYEDGFPASLSAGSSSYEKAIYASFTESGNMTISDGSNTVTLEIVKNLTPVTVKDLYFTKTNIPIDKGRTSDGVRLDGTIISTAYADVEQLNSFMTAQSEVEVLHFVDSNLDGDYVIRSLVFSARAGYQANMYDYQMELEKVRD